MATKKKTSPGPERTLSEKLAAHDRIFAEFDAMTPGERKIIAGHLLLWLDGCGTKTEGQPYVDGFARFAELLTMAGARRGR